MENKGAIDWTIGKLLSMILLVIVLVLVAYGVSTKGLNPLIERVGGMMDNVLILLNIREGDDEGCYSPDVASLSDGEKFLNNLGIESGSDVIKIDICKNGICTINFSEEIGSYRLNNGVFEKKVDLSEWLVNILGTGGAKNYSAKDISNLFFVNPEIIEKAKELVELGDPSKSDGEKKIMPFKSKARGFIYYDDAIFEWKIRWDWREFYKLQGEHDKDLERGKLIEKFIEGRCK